MKPATNEETERIETFTSLLPNLTEAVREGRTRHFADIPEEGDPEDDEPMLQIPTPHDAMTDQKPTQSAEARSPTSAGTDMEIRIKDRRVRFREERSPETSSGRIFGLRVDGRTAWENAEMSGNK